MTGWKAGVLVAVLALSLLGNALAIGTGIRLYKARHALMGGAEVVTLPRPLRRELLAALAAHEEDLRPGLHAVQDARRAVVEAATATPYDGARTAAALDALRAAVDRLMEQGQAVVLDRLAAR